MSRALEESRKVETKGGLDIWCAEEKFVYMEEEEELEKGETCA